MLPNLQCKCFHKVQGTGNCVKSPSPFIHMSVLLHRCTFLWETKETGNRAGSNLTFIMLTGLLIYPCITLHWWKWELVLGIGRGEE